MTEKLASFLVPVLAVAVLLYRTLASLQIALFYDATLVVIGIALAIALVLGGLAALGPAPVRIAVLTLVTVLVADATFRLPAVFEHLQPRRTQTAARDQQRIQDLHDIKAALDRYASMSKRLPGPLQYGEATGLQTFWLNWWDTSAHDANGDGRPFMEFLVEAGILSAVPVDPLNVPAIDGDPRQGKQYVYFVAPPGQEYLGGACGDTATQSTYLLAITDLESESDRPPHALAGSGCDCLWRDRPNFFQQHFDYILCGTVDATVVLGVDATQDRPGQQERADGS